MKIKHNKPIITHDDRETGEIDCFIDFKSYKKDIKEMFLAIHNEINKIQDFNFEEIWQENDFITIHYTRNITKEELKNLDKELENIKNRNVEKHRQYIKREAKKLKLL